MNAPTYTLPHRLNALSDLSESLADQPSGGWLARGVRASITEKLEANRKAFRTRAHDIQAVLSSGLAGPTLVAELWVHFPDASRTDVFWGAAMAVTTMVARVTLAECDLAIAVEELDRFKVELAALRAERCGVDS